MRMESVHGNTGDWEETSIVLAENWKGELLLLRRSSSPAAEVDIRVTKGKWVPIGGHVEREGRDKGTDPEEGSLEAPRRAAVREAKEESGMDISKRSLEHLSTFTSDTPEGRYLTHVFRLVLPERSNPEIRLSEGQPAEEHDAYAWVSKEVVLRHLRGPPIPFSGLSGAPRGKSDYTQLMLEIAEKGLIAAGRSVARAPRHARV